MARVCVCVIQASVAWVWWSEQSPVVRKLSLLPTALRKCLRSARNVLKVTVIMQKI